MRLFIAINFNDETKQKLIESIQTIKRHTDKGNFTKQENLHLTLVFIGETNKVSTVKAAMDKIDAHSFRLTIGNIGKFSRGGGDIYWAKADKHPTLAGIQRQLTDNLRHAGFEMENRDYVPHITLGREVVLRGNPVFDPIDLSVDVSKISLMKSERKGGMLAYTEIYSKKLTE